MAHLSVCVAPVNTVLYMAGEIAFNENTLLSRNERASQSINVRFFWQNYTCLSLVLQFTLEHNFAINVYGLV